MTQKQSGKSFDLRTPPEIDLLTVAKPPKGYYCERIIALSYCLDATVALSLLAKAYGVEDSDIVDSESGEMLLGKLEQKRLIQKVLSKSLFVIQHRNEPIGGIERIQPELANSLKDRVFVVRTPRAEKTRSSAWKNFHPKLVLMEFQSSKHRGRRWVRAYVGSKNLTTSSAFEAAVIFDIPPAAARDHESLKELVPLRPRATQEVCGTLVDLLVRMKNDAFSSEKSTETRRHLDFLNEWKTALLSKNSPFGHIYVDSRVADLTLHFQSPGSNSLFPLVHKDLKKARHILIVSPWTDVAINRKLADLKLPQKNLEIWTLDSEVSDLKPLVGLARRIDVDACDNLYSYEKNDSDEAYGDPGRDAKLHAKIIAIDFHNKSPGVLWLGSANWTSPGMGYERPGEENYELMARIELKGTARPWFGALSSAPIVAADTDDAKELIVTTPEERRAEILSRIVLSWAPYPSCLNAALTLESGLVEEYLKEFKKINFEVRRSGDLEQWINIGSLGLSSLVKDQSADLVVKGFVRTKDLIDSSIRLSTEFGADKGSIVVHVTVPDDVASLRLKNLEAILKPEMEDIFERLLNLQASVRGGTRRKSKSKKGAGGRGSNSIETFMRRISLERLFLALTDPDQDDFMFEDSRKEILDLESELRELLGKNPREDIKNLIKAINLIVKQAAETRIHDVT